MGGPRDRGFREESPLRLVGFITARASSGKPTHRRKHRHTRAQMYLVLWDVNGEAHHIPSFGSEKLNPLFHTVFFTLSRFSPCRSLTLRCYFFSLSLPSISLALSPSLALGGFLSAGLLSDREGFVRCQIPELRDQRQTKRLVTYCSILERQKKWNPS